MSLATIMLDQLAVARRVVAGGQEMVPVWRLETPCDEALLSVGVSRHERPAVLQRSANPCGWPPHQP